MKRIVLGLFLLAFLVTANASSIVGDYSFEDKSSSIKAKGVSYSLYLCSDGKFYYILGQHSGGSDIYSDYLISYGKYVQIKDTVVLNDRYHNLKMLLKVGNNRSLEAVKLLMVNKGAKFLLYSTSYEEEYLNLQVKTIANVKTARYRISYNSDNLKRLLHNIKCAKYRAFGEGILDLKANGEYLYAFDGIEISKGTWGIKDNSVILFDSFFKSNYFLTIKNQSTLVSSFVPLDFWNTEFILEEELLKRRNPPGKVW